MSRDGSGTYSLPNAPVVSGTIIESTWANTTMDDLADSMTNSLSRNGQGGMLAPLRGVNGTEAGPAHAFTQSPGSGMWRTPGTLNWSVDGTELLKIDDTGAYFKGDTLGAAAFVSDTQPPNPTNGQAWWESSTGIEWIWYEEDGTPDPSGQWVDTGPGGGNGLSGGGGGGGGVTGPGSVALPGAGVIATYADTTGDFLSDSNIVAAELVAGPEIAVDTNFPAFTAGSGRLVVDSGFKGSDFLTAVDAAAAYAPLTMTTPGDVLYFDATGHQRLPVGNDTEVLTLAGGFPSWEAPAALPLTTEGDLLYEDATGLQRLGIGNTDEVLKVIGGVPSWGGVAGTGNVIGSSTGVDAGGEVAIFTANDGTAISNDARSLPAATVVLGPATAVAGNLGTLNAAGNVLSDSGFAPSDFQLESTAVTQIDDLTDGITGNTSVALGPSAGDVMTGSANTVVGNSAFLLNSAGNANTVVGQAAMDTSVATSNSTAIGYRALRVSTGGSNTAVGVNAGVSIDTGSLNTVVGANAGNTFTIGANNLVLGNNAQPSTDTVSNEITMGNANITAWRIPGLTLDTNAAAPDQIMVWNGTGFDWEGKTAGGGEANTTSNEGAGEPLALTKSGVNLPFKTIVAGTGITLTPGADTLTVTAAAGGGNVVGSGTSVVGNVAEYTNTTSTGIGPSGLAVAEVVTNDGTGVAGNLPVFGAGGPTDIEDSGTAATDILTQAAADALYDPLGTAAALAGMGIQFSLDTGANKEFTLDEYAGFAYTIDEAVYKTTSGTITANVRINGTSVTGLAALAVTSAQTGPTAATALNTVAVGDKVTVLLSADSTAVDVSIKLNGTKT